MDLFSYKLGKKAGGGGSTPTLVTKNITENGTYAASGDNADGYSSVTVNVAASYDLSNPAKALNDAKSAIISALPNYYQQLINSYECDTDEATNIYTPALYSGDLCDKYLIYRKGSNIYRAMFFIRYPRAVYKINNEYKFSHMAIIPTSASDIGLTGIHSGNFVQSLDASPYQTAFSQDFSSLEECINALKTKNGYTYTLTAAAYPLPENSEILYSNYVVFDARVDMGRSAQSGFLTLRRISSNETIKQV